MPKVRRLIQFDPELLERIDAVRGDVPFAAWVRRMCEAVLPLEEKRVAAMQEWNASTAEILATFSAHDSVSPALKTLAAKVENLGSAPIPCQCGGVIYQSGSKKGRCSKCSHPKPL